ncbi:MAG: transposase [Eubacteriaceae bacterium]|nr:transposase [Eubacteriaceae bacterium]
MPRPIRDESALNIYHVLISGNNNEDVFRDDEDKKQLLDILDDRSESGDCEVFAFCILFTKANLLIKPIRLSLSELMHQINVSYALYFNRKYARSGHVFRDRFRSVAVNSRSQFVAVMRYIYMNPVIEGIVAKPEDYRYSNSMEAEPDPGRGFDSVFGYYDKCYSNLEQIADSLVKAYLEKHHLSYDSLKNRVNCDKRNELVLLVRDSTGYSIRKISQLLRINRGEVYRIIQIQTKGGVFDDL